MTSRPPTQVEEIREATREMHAAIKDARSVLREINETRASVAAQLDGLGDRVDHVIGDEIAAGLKRYEAALDGAIANASEAVDRRFDTIADILLGEDAKAKGIPLREHAERVAQVNRDRVARRLAADGS